MVTKTERTTIVLPAGMSDSAKKLGINISYEARIALKKAMSCKGQCPLNLDSDDFQCPIVGMGCKGTYKDWCTCPQNRANADHIPEPKQETNP